MAGLSYNIFWIYPTFPVFIFVRELVERSPLPDLRAAGCGPDLVEVLRVAGSGVHQPAAVLVRGVAGHREISVPQFGIIALISTSQHQHLNGNDVSSDKSPDLQCC